MSSNQQAVCPLNYNTGLGEPITSHPSLLELQGRAFQRFGGDAVASFGSPLSPQVRRSPPTPKAEVLRNVFAQVDLLLQQMDDEFFDLSQ